MTRPYQRPGPFATAYLDATRTTELGAEHVRLRWQALRSTLLHAGADEATLAALDASAENRMPGQHGRVLRRSQVDSVLLVEDPPFTLHAWIGPQPLQVGLVEEELSTMGVAAPQRDRLDAALVRPLAGTDASLLSVPPDDVTLPDGIAALLRSPDEATAQ